MSLKGEDTAGDIYWRQWGAFWYNDSIWLRSGCLFWKPHYLECELHHLWCYSLLISSSVQVTLNEFEKQYILRVCEREGARRKPGCEKYNIAVDGHSPQYEITGTPLWLTVLHFDFSLHCHCVTLHPCRHFSVDVFFPSIQTQTFLLRHWRKEQYANTKVKYILL